MKKEWRNNYTLSNVYVLLHMLYMYSFALYSRVLKKYDLF